MIYHNLDKIKPIVLPNQSSLIYFARVITSSLLLTLGAQIQVTLPFSLVPFTLQTEALIFLSFLWGSKVATGAVLTYFTQGIMGLPVFAGASCGLWSFFSFSGGYLLGFLPAAWIMGICADRGWTKNIFGAAAMALTGQIMIFSCGLLQLSLLIPANQLLNMGLYPFIIDILLQIAAAGVLAPAMFSRKK